MSFTFTSVCSSLHLQPHIIILRHLLKNIDLFIFYNTSTDQILVSTQCLLPSYLIHIVLFCLRPSEILFHLLNTPPEKPSGPLYSTLSSVWTCRFASIKHPKPNLYPQLNVINLRFVLIRTLGGL